MIITTGSLPYPLWPVIAYRRPPPLPPTYVLLYMYMKNVMKSSGKSASVLAKNRGKALDFKEIIFFTMTLFSSLVLGYVSLIYREALGTVTIPYVLKNPSRQSGIWSGFPDYFCHSKHV